MTALGIDIGTTTISIMAIDGDTRRVYESFTTANPGFISAKKPWEKLQDPAAILGTVREKLDGLIDKYHDIKAIGLTGQMHGIVYVDALGRHISSLYTWQDERGNQAVSDGKNVCQLAKETCGVKLYAGYGLATHLYNHLKVCVPGQAACICTISDYLGMALTGRTTPLLHTSNAASMGFYNGEANQFQASCLEQLGIDPSILPDVTSSLEVLGHYRGVPVCVAIGDNQASFLGSVSDLQASILVNMGTGGQVSVRSERFFETDGIEARPFINGDYLLVGSSLCGGRAYAVLAEFFRQCAEMWGVEHSDPYEMMTRLLENSAALGDSLEVDTRFSGTREQPELRGSIRNISTGNFTPAALTAGVLEGMVEELYQLYRRMGSAAVGKRRVIASGNGLRKNAFLREAVSRRFSMEIELAGQQEEAAFGAALAGLIGTGQ